MLDLEHITKLEPQYYVAGHKIYLDKMIINKYIRENIQNVDI